MNSPEIIMNDDVARAVADIQDPEMNEGLRDGLQELMTFVIGSGEDAKVIVDHASTINLLQQFVRKLSVKG